MPRFFLILFLLLAKTAYSQSLQEDSVMSASIESAINRYSSETPKLLFQRNDEVIIDSSFFRKVGYSVNKKEVNITLHDYTHKTVSTTEFWGLQTDFGQWQRFYKGEKYIVWHTRAPYIYREYAASDRKINYFYSKNLVSEILPLTKENIYEIADSNDIKQLKAYLKTHDIKKSKDGFDMGSGNLPLSELFSDGDDETPEALDLLMFHIKLHVYVIIICAEILECSSGTSKPKTRYKCP